MVCFRRWEDSRIVDAAVLVPGQLCGVPGERKSLAMAVRIMARDGEASNFANPATGKAEPFEKAPSFLLRWLVSEWP